MRPPGLALPLTLLLVYLGWAVSAAPQLRFGQGGTFKLVQFTDLHFGEDTILDEKTNQVQSVVLAAERPSLVVFSGDMVSGWASGGRHGWYAERWEHLTAPVEAAGVPHASILGNHDGEGDLTRREIVDLDKATSNTSLTQQGPMGTGGASNYYIDIFDPEGEAVAARIWMLDSNDRGCGQMRAGWGCVTPRTLEWVSNTADRLPTVPSLAFIHIPVPQFMEAWSRHDTNGSKGEPTGCPMVDTHVFDVLRDAGIRAIYSGHDHNNDFEGKLKGVRLAYGRKTGYAEYGPPAGMLHGARVILLRRGETTSASETWIRQEDGSRQDQGPTPAAAKRDTQQHTCISDLGLLGWAGWSTRAARMSVGSTLAAAGLAAVSAGLALVWWRRPAAAQGAATEAPAAAAAVPLLGKRGHNHSRGSSYSFYSELSLSLSMSSRAGSDAGEADAQGAGLDGEEAQEQGAAPQELQAIVSQALGSYWEQQGGRGAQAKGLGLGRSSSEEDPELGRV